MRESELEKELKQAEEVYDGLVQTRRSLGTMLAQTIRRGRDLDEFGRHLHDLPALIREADIRRTELRRELFDLRAKCAEDGYRRAAVQVSKAARALEQARSAYVKSEETAKRSGLEARRLAEMRNKEAKQERTRRSRWGTRGDARRGPRNARARTRRRTSTRHEPSLRGRASPIGRQHRRRRRKLKER